MHEDFVSTGWDSPFNGTQMNADSTNYADHHRMKWGPLTHSINVSELIHAVGAPSRLEDPLKEIIRVHP